VNQTILSVAEVAQIFQLSSSTIYKKYESGQLPGFKLGSRLRFLSNEIDDYLKKTIYNQKNQNEKMWGF